MEGHDLSHIGWDGFVIPSDLIVSKDSVPSWKDLKLLRDPQLLNGVYVRFSQRFFSVNSEKYVPAYIKGELDDDNGGYSSIYKGKRAIFKPVSEKINGFVELEKNVGFTTVCIKIIPVNINTEEDRSPSPLREKYYEDEINAIIYETYIQTLVSITLNGLGYTSAVPNIYEVLATSTNKILKSVFEFKEVWTIMEYLHGSTMQTFLLYAFKKGDTYQNETILLDVLFQLAFYLNILQSKLRFNHRDLKINNVFVRLHEKADDWNLVLPIYEGYTCINNVMLIDFGFSCVSCNKIFEHTQSISAGSWFNKDDICLKYGRDLAQFLYSLHATFPLHSYISSRLFELLYSLVNVEYKGVYINLFHGFDEHGVSLGSTPPAKIPFNDGIYKFLRQCDVDIPGCAPNNILEKLYKYNKQRQVEKI